MKLHVCCGEVYLIGWHNVDIYIPGYSFLASERPDLVKINSTTLENYYKYEFGKHPVKLCVVDEFKDVRNLDYPDNSCEAILMISAIEHFTLSEARDILRNFYRMLKPGGTLIFDFPDIEASLEAMKRDRSLENLNWQIRLIYGSQKNAYSFHKWGYTKETILDELQRAGFNIDKVKFETVVEHFYPMIGVKVVK